MNKTGITNSHWSTDNGWDMILLRTDDANPTRDVTSNISYDAAYWLTPTTSAASANMSWVVEAAVGGATGVRSEVVVALVLVSVMVPWILISNLLVIFSVVYFRRLQTAANYFLVILAIADLMTGVLIPFRIVTEVYKDVIVDELVCLVPRCLMSTTSSVSILTLAGIAFDRYIAIARPLKYAHFVSNRRLVVFAVVAWICSGLVSWTPVMGWSSIPTPGDRKCTRQAIKRDAMILVFSVTYIPSFAVMVFCYVQLFLVARQQARAIAALELSVKHRSPTKVVRPRDTKYTKTVFIVMGVFVAFWLPYVTLVMTTALAGIRTHESIGVFLALLTYCNSGINPWIYAYRGQGFKISFKALMRCVLFCHKLQRDHRRTAMVPFAQRVRALSLSTGNLFSSSTSATYASVASQRKVASYFGPIKPGSPNVPPGGLRRGLRRSSTFAGLDTIVEQPYLRRLITGASLTSYSNKTIHSLDQELPTLRQDLLEG